MKRSKRKRSKTPRDMFAFGRRKGTQMAVTVDVELIKILDAFRHDVDERVGVELTRRQVLEGLLRKVWRKQIEEAALLDTGAPLSDHFESSDD